MAGKSAPRKRKTVSRFQSHQDLAGSSEAVVAAPSAEEGGEGVSSGLAAAVHAAGHRIRQMRAASLLPHPYNDPARSEPDPQDEAWLALVRNVEVSGVRIPALAVTRSAFVAARPELASSLPETGSHVLVYGHRRRAATLAAGRDTMPVVVDDSVLDDDGDLDRMVAENLGRKDLPPLAEARLFSRYSESLRLSQRAIADRLGIDQATVSRRLSLMLLGQRATAAVADGTLPVAAAAALGGALPFGPARGWQKNASPEQSSDERELDQEAALSLILEQNLPPTRAAERVQQVRASREKAHALGVRLVDDPASELGVDYVRHQVDSHDQPHPVIAAIDPATGSLTFYSVPGAETLTPSAAMPSSPSPTVEQGRSAARNPDADDDDRDDEQSDALASSATIAEPVLAESSTDSATGASVAAREARSAVLPQVAASVPAKGRLVEVIVEAISLGVDVQHPAVVARADAWPTATSASADPFKIQAAIAWRRILAGYEDLVDRHDGWPAVGAAYLDLLHERGGYVPTAWERQASSAGE